ncbi:MAG: phosphoribosylanthranilate isomerase [Gammaproteobacteria bacterium]|nr:phosphoribosylanthranilate isomerase [Gammaproteobacteria bacterium]
MFVKICGLREQQHVDAALDAGADALGFVFARSPREVTPAHAAEVSAHVDAGVLRVAVMLHPSNDEWQAVLNGFAPDVLQTDAGDFASLDVPNSVARWPVYREGGLAPDYSGAFLYEGARSGHGETVDWSRAAAHAAGGRMLLAGGLTSGNVAEAIATVRPWGVDVSSAVESAPGVKDSAMIVEFINAAKAAGKQL